MELPSIYHSQTCAHTHIQLFLSLSIYMYLGSLLHMPPQVGSEAVRIANYCLDCLKRSKPRDFPPSTKEIEGIISGKGLVCIVHCVGGR